MSTFATSATPRDQLAAATRQSSFAAEKMHSTTKVKLRKKYPEVKIGAKNLKFKLTFVKCSLYLQFC